jgi:hypothetical protein
VLAGFNAGQYRPYLAVAPGRAQPEGRVLGTVSALSE